MKKRVFNKVMKLAIDAFEKGKATKEQEYFLVKQFGQEFITDYYSNKRLVRLINLKGKKLVRVLSNEKEVLVVIPTYFNKYEEEISERILDQGIKVERLTWLEIFRKYGENVINPLNSDIFPLVNAASVKDFSENFLKLFNGYKRYYSEKSMLNLNYEYQLDLLAKAREKNKKSN